MDEQEMIFEDVYTTYFKIICAYIMTQHDYDYHTAEDLTSETFYKLQMKWEGISPHTPGIILSWLYRTASFCVKDYKKQRSRRPEIAPVPPTEPEFSDHGIEAEEVDEQYSYQMLLRNIQQTLSQRDWELFVAIYIDELPLETILQAFHLKTNTFYMKKARIKRRLKNFQKFSKNFDEK